jgi:hypothetical protein
VSHPHPMLGCSCQPCHVARVRQTAPTGMAACDRCGHEFVYWTNGEADDLFVKIAAQVGRIVCPDCINDVQAGGES